MSEEAGGATIDLDLDMNWATVRYSGGIAVNLNQADVNDYIHLGEGTRDIAAANQLTITSQVDRIGEDTTTQFTKAVGWTPAVDTTVDQITVSLLETGTIGAGDIWFEIWDDDAASPGTLITGGTTATKPAADIDGTSWDHFDLPAPVTLIGGNTYYIVAQFDFAVSSSNYLRWRSDAAGVAGFDGWTIHQDDTEAAITASPSLALRGANTDAGISVTAGSVVVTKGAAPIVPAPITVTVSAGSLVVSVPGGADQAVNLAPEYELLTDYFEHNDLTTDWGSPPAGMSIAGGIVTTAVDATNDAPKLAQSLSTEDQADVWVHYRVRINSHTSVDTDYVQGFGLWGTASFFKAFLLGFINVSDELFLRLTYQPDAGQVTQDGSIPLDLGTWYDIKVHWVHATAPAADNGTLTVWVNNVQEFAETGIDNDTHEGDYFTIGNNFRSVMDITYDLDWIGVSAFEPIGHVVGVTPGSMILTTENAIVPAPVTVTVSAGSMVVTTGSVPIVPAPVTVNVTPGTTVLTGANAVVPAPITVTVTTGSMVVTTGSVAIVPAAATVTATPGSLVVTQPVAGFNIFWLSNSSNPSGSDNTIINHLESAGHTVTTESDQASPSPPTDILTYDLVILSEAVAGSSAPGADYLNTDIPLLSFEAYCLDEMEMAGGHTDDTAETQIEIVDDTHLIAGGLANGTHTITNSNTYNWQSSLGPDFHLVGETVGGNPLLGYYDEGDEGTGSFTMPNKRAFFTIRLAAMSGITATGLDIVDGIVEWLMDAGGPAAQNIVPAAATVTATPGSMAVTVGSLPIVPAVVTVTVTEGSVVLTGLNPIVPAVATVSATAGSLAVTTGSLPVIPAVVNVTATGSTLTVTVGSVAIVPDPHTVTATPSTVALTGVNAIALTGASVSVSAGSVVVTTTEAIAPAGASVSVTPSTVVVTVGSVPITPDAVTVTVTEGSLVVTTGALPVTPAAASVSITAGSMVLNTHQNITLTGASVSVTPSTLLLNTIQSITPGAQSVDVTAGSMTLTVGSLPVTPSAASVTITAGSLVVVPAQLIALTGPTVTVTPAAVVITTGSVPITPDAVTVTVTPQSMVLTSVFPVVPSAAVVSVTPQALTVTVGSLPIVPAPHSVTATSGSLSVTVGAAPIALTGADVTATASTVTLTGLNPVSPVAASVAVLPSTLTVTTGSVPIVPDAATVNVSAGSVAVTTGAVNVVPDAATVTVTSGSMALTTGAIPISTAGASVTVTAGSLTLLVGQPIFAAAAVVTSTSGTMTITTGSVDITLTGATVAVSGGTVATSEPGDGNANTLMMMGLGA
jgi:hypothetical protein